MALTPDKKKRLDAIFQQTVNTSSSQPFQLDETASFDQIQAPQEATEKSGFKVPVLDAIKDVGIGALKGAASTAQGISSLGQKYLTNPINRALGVEERDISLPDSVMKPEGTAQKVGFGAEQIAEFLVPSSKVAKLEKGLGLAGRATTEAAVAGTQRSLQQGEVNKDSALTAIVGGMFPVAGAGLSKAKGLLKPVGQKIQQTVIKPGVREIEDGFDINNIQKYDVGGSLVQTVDKTNKKINELKDQLQSALGSSNQSVNLNKVYEDTINFLSGKNKALQFGDNTSIKRVTDSLKTEIEDVAGSNGLVDLVQATDVKRGAGNKGAWSFRNPDPDSSATEKVYTAFYTKLKEAIEKAAPDQNIKEINRQISELIPISNAALRRLPVDQRNNVIGLTDGLALFGSMFDPKALALLGANRLSKSGRFGQFLVKVAEKKQPSTSVGKRIFGE